MQGSIIVPLDGSRFGESALPYAFSIARRANLPVHLVHVQEYYEPSNLPTLAMAGAAPTREYSRDGQDYLPCLRDRTLFDRDVEIETALIEGDVADALDQYAHDVDASLIVMSTEGHGELRRFVLGSITDQMIRKSVIPLLLVHPDNEHVGKEVEGHLNHLLLPLESGHDVEQIVKPALELSALFDGDCTILHVVDDLDANDYAPRIGLAASDGERSEAYGAAASAILRRPGGRHCEQGNKIAVRIVESPYPAESVLAEAQSGQTDWIAISAQRRPHLSQLMFGSTADKIIQGAKVPVFVCFPQSA